MMTGTPTYCSLKSHATWEGFYSAINAIIITINIMYDQGSYKKLKVKFKNILGEETTPFKKISKTVYIHLIFL